eukprot:1687230-Rhodomonas_salina.2
MRVVNTVLPNTGDGVILQYTSHHPRYPERRTPGPLALANAGPGTGHIWLFWHIMIMMARVPRSIGLRSRGNL